MNSNLVGRVHAALQDAFREQEWQWRLHTTNMAPRPDASFVAKAVLRIIREPTQDMIEAATKRTGVSAELALAVFAAMIDSNPDATATNPAPIDLGLGTAAGKPAGNTPRSGSNGKAIDCLGRVSLKILPGYGHRETRRLARNS